LTGRTNQKRRTRRALLDAAVQLIQAGHAPAIAQVAEAALVSTATAYRYFPNTHALVLEVANREAAQRIDAVVAALPDDPEQRIEVLVGAIAGFQLENEALWRGVLNARLQRCPTRAEALEHEPIPVRSGGQLHAVRAALAPLSESLGPQRYRRLVMATMVVCGTEAMVAARDACALEPIEAREVIQWAARAMLRSAVHEHNGDT
jgi:AcrR family transcriptional regulator